ncbi:MAG: cytochrome c biogenesis protein CcsA, partial [Bacteroidales bacterium]|nr:cytochrome c biogenesis protein CcsA [Bacteroidales bacterium]
SLLTARILLAIGAIILAIEGTWSIPLHRSYVFLVFALLLLFALTATIYNGFKRKAKPGFLLNHIGIYLIIWAALFGSPDVSRSRMIVGYGHPQKMAYSSDGKVISLPFEVTLTDFHIDYYSDSISPRQFTSDIIVDGKAMSVSVNNPCSAQGYTLYQDSYDWEALQYTVLQVVSDPWLPVVFLGMTLLALGSVLLLFGRWKARFVIPVTLLLTIVFTMLTVAKINFGTLMPALRSWWFVPHLFIYMIAYSLMAIALVIWIAASLKKRESWQTLSDNLVRSSSALLIIGMLTGSVWARQAWGDYWAWDAKENWAAVTWLVTLMHLHLKDKSGWKAITILILAFLALQITWYGVNYLPSAINSLHTYNS